MKGIIIKSTGNWYTIRDDKGQIYTARIKGRFRIQNIQHTNPIAVGDHVDFETGKNGNIRITQIAPRKNYIIRQSVNLSKRTHIIASNIDLAFLMITLVSPETSIRFIDRFLVTAQAYAIPVVLLFNKIDILSKEKIIQKNQWIKLYRSVGYPCYEISALQQINIEKIKPLMKKKISMISGYSGTGKSTLINTLSPGLNLKTKEVSSVHYKGQHTTTFAEMFSWPFGGYIIDTPGIKGLGLVEMKKEEIGGYFPEILALKPQCKFNNCLHQNEPECAVKKAVEEGKIARSRFSSYLSFLTEESQANYRLNDYEN